MKKVIIKLDSTENTVAYLTALEMLEQGVDLIETCCLELFNFRTIDKGYVVELVKSNGDYIVLNELYKDNKNEYTTREIKEGHNVLKLFINGDFKFKNRKEH